MSTQADHIISKFPSQNALAEAIGIRQSVVWGWKKRGVIPVQQWGNVIDAAQKLGVSLSRADLAAAVDLTQARRPKKEKEAAA